MSLDARVLIVARDDDLAGPLSQGLDRLGWRTVTARGPYAALATLADFPIEAAVVDVASYGEDAPAMARRLKAAALPRRLPVIAIGSASAEVPPPDAYDLTLPPPLHPSQAIMRLESLIRMAIAEEEFELRQATFAGRGRTLDPPETNAGPLRILAIGEPAPQFLGLSNALTQAGAQVVGAFTAYTAFDYLHEMPFDAAVLWAGEDQTEAMSIAGGMRRNTRLFHVPALLYLKEGSAIRPADAYNRGVSDVASPDTPSDQTAGRVLELARAYRRETAIRRALEQARTSGLMDAATGLFTRELFAAHLARLAGAARERKRALSVCVLRIGDKQEIDVARRTGWLERAIPQIGSMVGRLVRVEDTAARLGPEVFALALPNTHAAAGRVAGERIAAVIACTAFDAGDDRPPFVAEFEIGVAEVDRGENPAAALERAATRTMRLKAG